jgi:large subunit ribosomal protein L9
VQARLKKEKISAVAQSQEIEKITCTFKKKAGDNGKLFGAVTTQEISEKLREYGIELDRRKLQLKEPIKLLGNFEVSVKLHPEVIANIKIRVMQEETDVEKTPEQAKEETSS